ncbi:DUF885 domain-containing protein [Sulfobacillus thermosulfidooxidans]|uniref:DUF885 domain-containing protein n=1 Tax=Sulfobacillus thermosulfidooxidans TaxID=28034 RepID=UPI00096B748A|nr:DUF885 domain-containing protein [Sulfobacillus thermosulfidooxidans]OLZ09536.1 hypothetical protein BFX05_11230 [Sulfobacillus thermosulfidooxidans]OLZ16158.1 hypothetical protein BFX06_03810 [Sulfobacillus thermosulfidooxidans]OLZ17994.1 hypothetical protein BFX07_06320 [Sulfobacillus thermosulfidooxidans]
MKVSNREFYAGLPKDEGLRPIAEMTLEIYLQHFPFVATDLGLHDWDEALPPVSEASRQAFEKTLSQARTALNRINPETLDREDWADYMTLKFNVESLWLDVTRDHPERKDPNLFNAVISASLLSLARGQFGTADSRGQALLERLRQVPGFLMAGLRQLDNPPVLYVDMAIDQFTRTLPFLRDDIPQAFQHVNSRLRQDIAEASEQAAQAYENFVDDLKTKIKPKAHGDYRLGPKRYWEKFYWLEGNEASLDELLRMADKELERLQAKLKDVVAQYDPSANPQQVIAHIRHDHWSRDTLLKHTSQLLDQLRDFVERQQLVSIPQSLHPRVVETPAFMRLTTLASIVPPGPFEQSSRQAYYQVTLPDSSWSLEDQDAQLQTLNKATMQMISIHEVYPGHFVQFLQIPKTSSTVRRIFGSGAFIEGWAHYTEELMIEQGYGDGNLALQISYVLEALERLGRFIVAIRLHRGDVTLDDAQKFFETECFMTPMGAKRETLRGTQDPFYLIYTWGKFQILHLRRKAQERWGSAFTLQRFHDALLSHGMPMFPVLEKLLFSESK